MPKKQKRSVSRSDLQVNASVTTQVTESPRPFSTSRASTSDFNPDYSYVISDLKRIGILAGSFITILVVLSLFLR